MHLLFFVQLALLHLPLACVAAASQQWERLIPETMGVDRSVLDKFKASFKAGKRFNETVADLAPYESLHITFLSSARFAGCEIIARPTSKLAFKWEVIISCPSGSVKESRCAWGYWNSRTSIEIVEGLYEGPVFGYDTSACPQNQSESIALLEKAIRALLDNDPMYSFIMHGAGLSEYLLEDIPLTRFLDYGYECMVPESEDVLKEAIRAMEQRNIGPFIFWYTNTWAGSRIMAEFFKYRGISSTKRLPIKVHLLSLSRFAQLMQGKCQAGDDEFSCTLLEFFLWHGADVFPELQELSKSRGYVKHLPFRS